MTIKEHIITIGICVFATMLTRFLPFIIFRNKKTTPKYVDYLGKMLPGAIFAMLVVYCLKSVDLVNSPHGLYEFTGIIITTGLHLLKRNMFISILGGTLSYIIMVNPTLSGLL